MWILRSNDQNDTEEKQYSSSLLEEDGDAYVSSEEEELEPVCVPNRDCSCFWFWGVSIAIYHIYLSLVTRFSEKAKIFNILRMDVSC